MIKVVVYIISNIDKAISFEWIFEHLKNDFDLNFIFLGSEYPESGRMIGQNGGNVYYFPLKGKKDYPVISFKLIVLLKRLNPEIVHTHLRDADILGLSISKLLGIKKQITTRHFSTYNRDYHPKSVLVDKLINRWATNIVAISENVKQVLIDEGVSNDKITLIHHGFDLDKFKDVDPLKFKTLKTKYHTQNNYPVIGVISRYIEWKGHKYIIEAFKYLLNEYPNAKLILANANGSDKNKIQKQLKYLPDNSYIEIPFETDIFTLYQLFDVFVHTPIDPKIEAFGQVYVEALAAGIPSVFTLSGVAHEFINDKENAVVVDYKNSGQNQEAYKLILKNPELKNKIIENGIESVDKFRLDLFIQKIKALYVN